MVILASIIATITMTLGNTVALSQENLSAAADSSICARGLPDDRCGGGVRLRARASAASTSAPRGSPLFYLVAYALYDPRGVRRDHLPEHARAADRGGERPGRAGGRRTRRRCWRWSLCLFSLAGIPPLAGFYGKFQIFAAAFAVPTGPPDARLLRWLAVIGVINSAIGAYYYLRIVVLMYLRPATTPINARPAWPTMLAVLASASLPSPIPPVSRLTRAVAEAALAQPEVPPEPVTVAR